jgi:hypothetical protein
MLNFLDLVRSDSGFQRIVVGGYIDANHVCIMHQDRSTVLVYVFTTTYLNLHQMHTTQWCYRNLAYNGYRKVEPEDMDDEDLAAIDEMRTILKTVNDNDVKHDEMIDHPKNKKIKRV